MVLGGHHDLGASVFQGWTEEQKRAEIGKLVAGYRKGVPVGILCKMAETIAGNREAAREHLHHFMTPKERKKAMAAETGGMRILVEEFLR